MIHRAWKSPRPSSGTGRRQGAAAAAARYTRRRRRRPRRRDAHRFEGPRPFHGRSSDVTGTSVEGAGPLESMSVATPGAATSTTSVTSRRRRRSLPPSRPARGTGRFPGPVDHPRRRGVHAKTSPREIRFAPLSLSLSLFSSILEILFRPRRHTVLGTHHRSPRYRRGFPSL